MEASPLNLGERYICPLPPIQSFEENSPLPRIFEIKPIDETICISSYPTRGFEDDSLESESEDKKKYTTCCLWPNCKQLGLNEEQVEAIEQIVHLLSRELLCQKATEMEHIPYSSAARGEVFKIKGVTIVAPRSIFVTKKVGAYVLLGDKGVPTIKGGGDQSTMSLAWRLDNGKIYIVKKSLNSMQDALFEVFAHHRKKNSAKIPFPKIVPMPCEKGYFLEKWYRGGTLSKWFNLPVGERHLSLRSLKRLQNAVMIIHSCSYTPPQVKWTDREGIHKKLTDVAGGYFHGDLSPNNILCQEQFVKKKNRKIKKQTTFILTDFGAIDFRRITGTFGWSAPEVIKYTQACRTEEEIIEFRKTFGQKNDIWSLGILFWTILMGGFHPNYPEEQLPHLSCIVKRLIIREDSETDSEIDFRLNEGGLRTIDQQELDDEIDRGTKAMLEDIKSSKKRRKIKKIASVIKQWLTVLPEHRPSLQDCCF